MTPSHAKLISALRKVEYYRVLIVSARFLSSKVVLLGQTSSTEIGRRELGGKFEPQSHATGIAKAMQMTFEQVSQASKAFAGNSFLLIFQSSSPRVFFDQWGIQLMPKFHSNNNVIGMEETHFCKSREFFSTPSAGQSQQMIIIIIRCCFPMAQQQSIRGRLERLKSPQITGNFFTQISQLGMKNLGKLLNSP